MDGGDTLETLRRRLQRIRLNEEEVVALIAREELRVSHRLRDAAARNVAVETAAYSPGDRIEVLNPGSSGRYGTVTRATNRGFILLQTTVTLQRGFIGTCDD